MSPPAEHPSTLKCRAVCVSPAPRTQARVASAWQMRLADVEMYDVGKDAWVAVQPLESARFAATLVAV